MLSAVPGWQVVLVLVVHDFVTAPLRAVGVSWVLVLVVHDFVAAPGAASWFGGTVWCVVAAVRHLGSSFNRSEPVATGPEACSCVG